jgi:hypothetical protein
VRACPCARVRVRVSGRCSCLGGCALACWRARGRYGMSNRRQVACGASHTVVVTSVGDVFAFGHGEVGLPWAKAWQHTLAAHAAALRGMLAWRHALMRLCAHHRRALAPACSRMLDTRAFASSAQHGKLAQGDGNEFDQFAPKQARGVGGAPHACPRRRMRAPGVLLPPAGLCLAACGRICVWGL